MMAGTVTVWLDATIVGGILSGLDSMKSVAVVAGFREAALGRGRTASTRRLI
jgi:hypothetical protein